MPSRTTASLTVPIGLGSLPSTTPKITTASPSIQRRAAEVIDRHEWIAPHSFAVTRISITAPSAASSETPIAVQAG